MGIYVEVKLHTGEVLGMMEILRQGDELQAINRYRYRLDGVDPGTRMRQEYRGTVEHPYCEWVWTLIYKVLNDKEWER